MRVAGAFQFIRDRMPMRMVSIGLRHLFDLVPCAGVPQPIALDVELSSSTLPGGQEF